VWVRAQRGRLTALSSAENRLRSEGEWTAWMEREKRVKGENTFVFGSTFEAGTLGALGVQIAAASPGSLVQLLDFRGLNIYWVLQSVQSRVGELCSLSRAALFSDPPRRTATRRVCTRWPRKPCHYSLQQAPAPPEHMAPQALPLLAAAGAAATALLLWRRWRRCSDGPLPSSPCRSSCVDLVFGYGSIMEDESRQRTQSKCACRAAVLCELHESAGWERSWCCRVPTGFTALGLKPGAAAVCGIAFPIGGDLRSFDEREVGYERVLLTREQISCCIDCERNFACDCCCDLRAVAAATTHAHSFRSRASRSSRELLCTLSGTPPPPSPPPPQCNAPVLRRFADWLNGDDGSNAPDVEPPFRVWAYVPLKCNLHTPSRAFPICESYLDVVLHGCLEWGGEQLALSFCETTAGWSENFLDDVVVSRRPWLHRPQSWQQIDTVLRSRSEITLVDHRMRSEDHAAAAQLSYDELREQLRLQQEQIATLCRRVRKLEASGSNTGSSNSGGGRGSGSTGSGPDAAGPDAAGHGACTSATVGLRRPSPLAPLPQLVVVDEKSPNAMEAPPQRQPTPPPPAGEPSSNASTNASSGLAGSPCAGQRFSTESPRKKVLRMESPSLALALARAEQRAT
jgi:hypothetical protein